MDGVLLVFRLPEGSTAAQHRKFRRRIYGDLTTSWGGRYRYHRKGLLDEIPHVLLYTGVVIVRAEDETRLARGIRENGGTILRRMVRLLTSDRRTLGEPLG